MIRTTARCDTGQPSGAGPASVLPKLRYDEIPATRFGPGRRPLNGNQLVAGARHGAMRAMLLIIAFVAPACAPSDGDEPPERIAQADSRSPANGEPSLAMTNVCLNPTEGYAIEYPADWHVNTDEIAGPCSLFDAEPIRIPRDSELPLEIAITVGFEAVPFSVLTGEVFGRRTLSREPTTIDGREAMRIDGETTGEGLHDRGIRSYQYLVNLGDTTMIASTYDVGDLPFERKRGILDAMMATFDFRQPG